MDYSKLFSNPYSPTLKSDYITLMGMVFVGSNGFGIAGYLGSSYSDILGEHRVIGQVVYYGYEKLGGGNADIAYYYLKNRTDVGIGFFTQGSPFGIVSLDTVNELIYNVYSDTISVRKYGGYGVVSYPFTKFFKAEGRLVTSRYEWDYDQKPDVYANLNTVELSLQFDNTVMSFLGPADGSRVILLWEKTMNFTGQDYSYGSMNVDARKYFFFRDYYIFAFRGAAGRIYGRDKNSFKYLLGGFNTVRGFGWAEFEGSKMFLFNAEFRFVTIEGLKFGFPLFFGIRGIGGVIFADAGAAWDTTYQHKNKDGTFKDFKTDLGFGFRIALVPAISLKLDFAWPYNNKNFDRRNILFSIGVNY